MPTLLEQGIEIPSSSIPPPRCECVSKQRSVLLAPHLVPAKNILFLARFLQRVALRSGCQLHYFREPTTFRMADPTLTLLRPFRMAFLSVRNCPECQPQDRAHRLAMSQCYFDLWDSADTFCDDIQPICAHWEALMLRHSSLEPHQTLSRIADYFSGNSNFQARCECQRRSQTLVCCALRCSVLC